MMKQEPYSNLLFLTLLLLVSPIFVSSSAAQDDTQEQPKARVTDLQVPKSPVLNLLGVADLEITEPVTPKAFGFTIPTSLANSDGNFPNTYAVELAPYWWFDHPNLTFSDYYGENKFGESILKSFSFSIGTTQTTTTVDESEVEITKLGVGLRTSLLAGNKHPQFEAQQTELTDSFTKCIRSNLQGDCIQESRNKLIKLEELGQKRVGWKLDLANAYAFNSEEDNFDDLDLAQIGIWLTASYNAKVHDQVVPRITDSECQAEINSLFDSYNLTFTSSFTEAEIQAASENYACIRYPGTNKIAFYDRADTDNIDKQDTKDIPGQNMCESSNDEMCLKQSGLSVSRIVDKNQPNPEDISDTQQKSALDKCNWGLEMSLGAEFTPPGGSISLPRDEPDRIPLLAAQRKHFDEMEDLDNSGNNQVVFTNKPDISQFDNYECEILTKSDTLEAFIVNDSGSTTDSHELTESCQQAVEDFIVTNEIAEDKQDEYTCKTFSLSDLMLQIPYQTPESEHNVNQKCDAKTLKFKSQDLSNDDEAEDLMKESRTSNSDGLNDTNQGKNIESIKNLTPDEVDKYIGNLTSGKFEQLIEASNFDLTRKLASIYKCTEKPSKFTFLGIGRYINNQDNSGQDSDNYDLGASVAWQASSDSKLSLSGEYIRRFGEESDDRFVGGVRYKINNTYEVFASVGKAFDDGFSSDNLVSIIGIDFGFGQPKLSPAP